MQQNAKKTGDERIKEMKQTKKQMYVAVAALLFAAAFSITGCGKTENTSPQTENEVPIEILEVQQHSPEVQTAAEIVKTQEKDAETGSIMRTYSDKEKERMAELQQSYQNETAKPEKMIQEVDSAEDVTEGMLCYIKSTGEYYLPDRDLTDEELLEIIDCNFRIAINTSGLTQEKIDEENLKERAELEAKVKAADGISEEEAIEIASKAMETDLGEKGKGLKLHEDGCYGWRAYLYDLTDWDEYKDKGEIGYSIQFDNVEEIEDFDDLFAYGCVVNAIDGSICGAFSRKGLIGGDTTWYEH